MTRSTFYLRQYMTKALSITLILGLLLSSLALSSGLSESLNTIAQALTDNTKWTDEIDGIANYDVSWYYNTLQDNENATEFTISTAAELAGLAYLVNNGTDTFYNKTIKLTADIDLEAHYWVPIGKEKYKPFRGQFNGQGHTIKNMLIGTEDNPEDYVYAGLFGYVKSGIYETIQNVNIDENSKIYTYNVYKGYSGGICGFADGTMISKCTNSGTVWSNNSGGKSYTGGICGGTSSGAILSCCTNSGTVSFAAEYGEVYAGGICGYASDNKTKICYCINTGNICSTTAMQDNSKTYVGGVCGYCEHTVTIDGCLNNGDVSSEASYVYMGGICGCVDTGSSIGNSVNGGRVHGFSAGIFVGGICGFLKAVSEVNNCINVGIIDDNDYYYGEICGMVDSSEINNSYGIGRSTASLIGRETNGASSNNVQLIPTSQVKAAASSSAKEDWIEIGQQGKVALVDALNKLLPSGSSFSWIQDNDNNYGYPYLGAAKSSYLYSLLERVYKWWKA